jgi:membrane-associated protease RseP (regulator of RpoE activity)
VFGIPQPTQFDLHWRMFGIDVRVHPLFWLFSAVLGWGFTGGRLDSLAVWVVVVFVSVLVHELGHVLTGRIFGSSGHILLYSFGGLALGSNNLGRRWQRILVLFAGPLAGFLLAAVTFATLLLVPLPSNPLLREAVGMVLVVNIGWGILNLLPIFPLDGGQISREVLEGSLGHRGLLISFGISVGVAAALAVHMVWPLPFIPFGGHSIYNAIFFALLAVSSYQLLQAEMNRRPRHYDDDRLPWE